MNKLNITWDGVYDSTGYLFSFAKSLSAAVKNSPWSELSEDIIATSGFAFRMWVNPELCPSAMSIWQFDRQPTWIANGGLETTYAGCYWQPDNVMEQARLDVMPKITQSIDNGIPVIAWDIGVLEWGLLTGYDDKTQKFSTLSITGAAEEMDYALLGKREMPMLNVITLTDKNAKKNEDIIADTLMLAKAHLNGEEWCENIKGLDVYPVLTHFFEMDDTRYATRWNMEYYLGTYAALKWYARKFFEKNNLSELAKLYNTVYENWNKAFEIKKSTDLAAEKNRKVIAELLMEAKECERKAVELM